MAKNDSFSLLRFKIIATWISRWWVDFAFVIRYIRYCPVFCAAVWTLHAHPTRSIRCEASSTSKYDAQPYYNHGQGYIESYRRQTSYCNKFFLKPTCRCHERVVWHRAITNIVITICKAQDVPFGRISPYKPRFISLYLVFSVEQRSPK